MNQIYKQVDNFFEDPERVVSLSNNLNWYYYNQHPLQGITTGRYAGRRTERLHSILPEFFNYASLKIAETIFDVPKNVRLDYTCSMYFSYLTKEDNPIKDSNVDNIHQDENIPKAGLVYLTKGVNRGSGTSFYDSKKRKIKEAKNKYNRLISYDGKTFHGTTKYVDNRMALLFFFENLSYMYS